MLRIDLEAAGIPYEVEGPEGPLFADFHALRHSYVGLFEGAGISVKSAMALARHSDPKLTMKRYGRAHLSDLGAAVERLPIVGPARDHRHAERPEPTAEMLRRLLRFPSGLTCQRSAKSAKPEWMGQMVLMTMMSGQQKKQQMPTTYPTCPRIPKKLATLPPRARRVS